MKTAAKKLNAAERAELDSLRIEKDKYEANMDAVLRSLAAFQESCDELSDGVTAATSELDTLSRREVLSTQDARDLRSVLMAYQSDRGNLVGQLLEHRFDAAWTPGTEAHVWWVTERGLKIEHSTGRAKSGNRPAVAPSWSVTDEHGAKLIDTESFEVLTNVLEYDAGMARKAHAHAYPCPDVLRYGQAPTASW